MHVIVYLLLLYCAFGIQIGCAPNTVHNVNSVSIQPTPFQYKPISEAEATPIDKTPGAYRGCWSSYNGNVLSIGSKVLQTRNSYGPIAFRDVSERIHSNSRNIYLLKLESTDKSNELGPYISLQFLPDNEMESRDFLSYEDFQNGAHSGIHSRWVRDKCSFVKSLLK